MPAKVSSSSIKGLSFEQALEELEKIVRGLETGQMKLEEAVKAYERGAELRKFCEKELGNAEMRLNAIVKKEDGSLETRPFDLGTGAA